MSFGDGLGLFCTEFFRNLPKNGKPKEYEWTVLSCIVKTTKGKENFEMVCLATGTKCIGVDKMSEQGDILNDSHAEVVMRRGFVRYIYEQVERVWAGADSVLIRNDDNTLILRKEVLFHLFCSQTPCGDISNIPNEHSIFSASTLSQHSVSSVMREMRPLPGISEIFQPDGLNEEFSHEIIPTLDAFGKAESLPSTSVSQDLQLTGEAEVQKSGEIAEGGVQSGNVTEGDVQSANVAEGDVQSANVAEGDVQSANVAEEDVLSGEIAEGGVQSGVIAEGGVQSGNSTEGDVQSGYVAEGDVQLGEIAAGGVQSASTPERVASPNIFGRGPYRDSFDNSLSSSSTSQNITLSSMSELSSTSSSENTDRNISETLTHEFVKRRKLEDGSFISVTGAKTLTLKACNENDVGLGQPCLKPGKGPCNKSMSCTDKLAKWLRVGIQGALLSLMLAEPIYISTIVIGDGCDFSLGSFYRGLVDRKFKDKYLDQWKDLEENNDDVLPIVPRVEQCKITFDHLKTSDNMISCPTSIVWCNVKKHQLQVAVNGRKLGATKKDIDTLKASMMISKYNLFKTFMSLPKEIPVFVHIPDNATYKFVKDLSVDYYEKLNQVKKDFFGIWVTKPYSFNFKLEHL